MGVNYKRAFEVQTRRHTITIPKRDLDKIKEIVNNKKDSLGGKKYGSVSHYIHTAILHKWRLNENAD